MAYNGAPVVPLHPIERDEGVFKSLKPQTVIEVKDFSSQYGADKSRSYTVQNIIGGTYNYPNYGDFTQSLVFRTYGKWWSQCQSTRECFKYKNVSFISQDFVDIQFNEAVYPTEIEIFETYNPGSVVRILACNDNSENIYNRWFVLWSGNVQRCRHKARVFTPKLTKCPFKTRRVRLEFNQNHVEYYTEIDAVYLHGLDSKEEYYNDYSIDHLNNDFEKQITVKSFLKEIIYDEQSYNILLLPVEVINKIMTYLTFVDFGNLAKSCRSFRNYCYDPLWYKELDLQPYWQKINKLSLEFLGERCQSTEKLRLSWCGSNDLLSSNDFSSFLQKVNGRLRCLYLSCCRFVDASSLVMISQVCSQIEELDLSSCIDIPSESFDELANLTCLKRLNLYRTQITEINFEKIVRSCSKLMHLNLGGCYRFKNLDESMKCLTYCPNIMSLDLWRATSLTPNGVISISTNCPNLEEIDIGWCKNVRTPSCLRELVTRCRNLKKIFLTALRTVCDDDLLAISANCPLLEQLDILGTSFVSKKFAEMILKECEHLKFFDISFCSQLDYDWYIATKERYPHVSLKKSVQNMRGDY